MNKFLKELEKKRLDKALALPVDRNLDRIVTLYCNKAYKNKLENEITNNALTIHGTSNHSSIKFFVQIGPVKVRLVIDEVYDEPVIKAGYYEKGNE